jgi:D-alanyl-D-alanine carboxypeptidase (penicillin-binding protein 5/6)
MDNQHPHLIDIEGATKKNMFPVFAQLGILGTILFGIFGAWLFQSITSQPIQPNVEQNITTDNSEYRLAPQKIEKEIMLRAESAYVWDVRGQRALYKKNADETLPLASITKLMTALLAHELIPDDKEILIPLRAIQQEGSSGLSAGEQLDIEELRRLALVSSSNDAAYALAASVGLLLGQDDPASQFISGMNIRAKELGLSSLNFKNATGLDLSATVPGAVGSARDVSFLMEYIISNYPEIISPTQKSTTRIYNAAGAYHDGNNTNEVALQIPNMIGSKTGYTDLAGGNLTIAFDAGLNRPIIITVLGSTRNERFSDVLNLMEAVQETLSIQPQ